jgi:hypothetical protein
VALIEDQRGSDFDESAPLTNKGKHCTDHIKNEGETDVDCGGIKCPKCEHMKSCKSNCDCISGVCKNNECVPPFSCTDDIKNQDETDVDCGGIKCPRCEDKKTCKSNCDCIGGVCTNNKCGGSNDLRPDGLCSADDLSSRKPILLITFGRGSSQYSFTTPKRLGFTTTYKQRFEPNTDDGYFSFINSIHDDFAGSWHTGATDHTGNEGGYMFLVNADQQPGKFYNGTVNNLCVGQRYEFSVYLANICKPNKVPIKPNVLFQVRTTVKNELLAELSSGNVAEYNTLTWEKYGLSFIAKSSSVVLLMISNAPGGMGNDLALDDIALRVCGQTGSGFCPSN